MTREVELKAPFWSAGRIYRWDYEDKIGFGVPADWLAGEIIIKTSLGTFRVDGEMARAVVDKYKAYFTARQTRLGIIPRAICEKI